MVTLVMFVVVAYALCTAAIMYVNVVIFRVGDPKFIGGAFAIYWPLWTLAYSPLAIVALAAVWWSGLVGLARFGLAGAMLLIILVALEMSLLLDIHWSILLLEWVLLSLAFFGVAGAWAVK